MQFVHVWPDVPHAASARPSWQTPLESQHPVGHVVGLHEGMNAQYDPGSLHVRPCVVQFSHDAPAVPQTVLAVPARQTPFASQQPPQLVASHAGCMPPHLPSVHAEPLAEQTAHAPPPMPQASISLPRRHRPSESQQPAHDAAHDGAVP